MPAVLSPTAPLKYVVGIDIANDTFVACFGRSEGSQQLRLGKEATFDNTPTGLAGLDGQTAGRRPALVRGRGHGRLYEALAYFLADEAQALSVLLPNKVKHFAHSTEQKSKTDQLDARLFCRLGLERALPAWQPPTPALRQLRALARERQSLTRQGARLKTQRHACAPSYQPAARTLDRLAARQQLLVQQLKAVDEDLSALLESRARTGPQAGPADECARHRPDHGHGHFRGGRNQRLHAHRERTPAGSYAGLDVVQRQSGRSALATRISRRGNGHLRQACTCRP